MPSAVTAAASTSSPAPMTVHNVPPMTFHEKGEKLFLDDKHIDATHTTEVVYINNFKINYKDQQIIIPEVNLVVINKAPTDVILGHGSLKKHNVYGRLSRYFGTAHSDVENPAVRESCRSTKPACQRDSVATSMTLSAKVAMGKNATKRVHISTLLKQEEAGDPTEELLPEDILASYWLNPDKTEEFTFKVNGTEAEKRRLITLINQYRDVFATRLSSAQPARVTPMGMEVDYDAFKADKRSREPTRMQTTARKAAIQKWIAQAIADNIIRPSTAPAWSQIMLTPKPNGTWRFAMDYRAINKYTKASRAPIPNIKRLLSTIGKHSPRLFAKMDLTSGFYQTPLEEGAMKYTAFVYTQEPKMGVC